MILSWQLARKRIAARQRPSWIAAWGLVLFDFLCFAGVVWLLANPVTSILQAVQPPNLVTVLVLFVIVFLPMQAVLIVSSLWAARSRWEDKETADG